MTREQYESLKLEPLRGIARNRGLKGCSKMKKADLIETMLRMDAAVAAAHAEKEKPEEKQPAAEPADNRPAATEKNENTAPPAQKKTPAVGEKADTAQPAQKKTTAAGENADTAQPAQEKPTAAGENTDTPQAKPENSAPRRRGRPRKEQAIAVASNASAQAGAEGVGQADAVTEMSRQVRAENAPSEGNEQPAEAAADSHRPSRGKKAAPEQKNQGRDPKAPSEQKDKGRNPKAGAEQKSQGRNAKAANQRSRNDKPETASEQRSHGRSQKGASERKNQGRNAKAAAELRSQGGKAEAAAEHRSQDRHSGPTPEQNNPDSGTERKKASQQERNRKRQAGNARADQPMPKGGRRQGAGSRSGSAVRTGAEEVSGSAVKPFEAVSAEHPSENTVSASVEAATAAQIEASKAIAPDETAAARIEATTAPIEATTVTPPDKAVAASNEAMGAPAEAVSATTPLEATMAAAAVKGAAAPVEEAAVTAQIEAETVIAAVRETAAPIEEAAGPAEAAKAAEPAKAAEAPIESGTDTAVINPTTATTPIEAEATTASIEPGASTAPIEAAAAKTIKSAATEPVKSAATEPVRSTTATEQVKSAATTEQAKSATATEPVKPATAADAARAAESEAASAAGSAQKGTGASDSASPEMSTSADTISTAAEPETSSEGRPSDESGSDAQHRTQTERPGQKQLYFTSNTSLTRGVLEVHQEGYGFLRGENFLSGDDDVYVSPAQIRRFNLKTGDMIEGIKREKGVGDKNGALLYVSTVNDFSPDQARRRPNFENMTPVFPYERIRLEQPGGSTATRVVDLISPIGKGQRGMIVSPPKAGKTTLLKDIAKSILTGDPEAHLIILLVDERPEEVTDMKESVTGKNVEVIYSTFDEQPEHHMRVAEMVIERARRLVEHKQDVIILLDSITRLTRAYNLLVPPSGRTLSGGLDPAALYAPKRFFGAARKMREGGSLTILATALVDTGSKMDDVVYEEFKGTGNMELILDRKLQERRIFPAIDITKSGTRREDLLLTPDELRAVYLMRRRMNGLKPEDAVENILNAFARSKSNEQVVNSVLTKWV